VGWQSVFICEEHWEEQEGKRFPVRVLPDGVYITSEPCYLCGRDAFIPVRRYVEPTDDGGPCKACGEEGVIRINSIWYCLNHVAKGFEPQELEAQRMRRAWATGIADGLGLTEFNGPETVA
jgi:hypothetical protein